MSWLDFKQLQASLQTDSWLFDDLPKTKTNDM